MIPTIEDILQGLLDGTYLLDKAVRLVEQHIEDVGLRDHFAGLAMQAMTSEFDRVKSLVRESDRQGHSFATETAIQSYVLADAMLRVRK